MAGLDSHLKAGLGQGAALALVTSPAFESMLDLTATIPARLCEFFGFEMRLEGHASSVDFLACIKPRDVHARPPIHELVPSDRRRVPAWRRILRAARAWDGTEGLRAGSLSSLWLEFDEADFKSRDAVPSVFVGGRFEPDGLGISDLDQLHRMLTGRDLEPSTRTRVSTLLEDLGDGAHVFQVGFMLARRRMGVRLCLRNMPSRELSSFLVGQGWKGDARGLDRLLDDLSQHVDSIDVDVDVDERGIHEPIGLEASWLPDLHARDRLRATLDWLTSRGCVPEDAADRLHAWQGAELALGSESWPLDLLAEQDRRARREVSMFLRWLYHLKLKWTRSEVAEVKAYLAVHHLWPSPEDIRSGTFTLPSTKSE